MGADGYLLGLLDKYKANTDGVTAAVAQLLPIIKAWGGDYLLGVDYSGSIAKKTAISLSSDADLFLSLSSTTPDTLKNVYETLCNALNEKNIPFRKQNVSVGVSICGVKIDLVPGKRQSQYGNDHSLYTNKTGSWIKTDVAQHVSLVSNSGRTNEIRIMKVWRENHGLELPSIYIELATIDALKGKKVGDLANNVWQVITHIYEKIESLRYTDPANTNNCISDMLTLSEKRIIARQAKDSLSKGNWNEVVW